VLLLPHLLNNQDGLQVDSQSPSPSLCCNSSSSPHMSSLSCDRGGNVTAWTDLRTVPIFTIWVTGTLSAAFPILAYRSFVTRRVPRTLFEYGFPAWCRFYHSQIGTGSLNISVLGLLSPHHLSTSSPPPLASSPHRALEPHGVLMYALYPAIFSIIPDSDLLPQCSLTP
jgi:hypothetical protein